MEWVKLVFCPSLSPYVPNGSFLYTLKTSENFTIFWCFQGVEKGCIGNKRVKQVSFCWEKVPFTSLCLLRRAACGYFSWVKFPDSFNSSSEYQCHTGLCIDRKYLCDGDEDCVDGDDELNCTTRTCQPNEFRCNNGKCIMERWVKTYWCLIKTYKDTVRNHYTKNEVFCGFGHIYWRNP